MLWFYSLFTESRDVRASDSRIMLKESWSICIYYFVMTLRLVIYICTLSCACVRGRLYDTSMLVAVYARVNIMFIKFHYNLKMEENDVRQQDYILCGVAAFILKLTLTCTQISCISIVCLYPDVFVIVYVWYKYCQPGYYWNKRLICIK